jgi:hypothetical protein
MAVERDVATAAPSESTTGLLNAGTMTINGYAIGAAIGDADTASDATATSSTKAASAIAIAAAINQQSSLTGVTAKAEPNVIVGTEFTAAANTDDLFLNGVTISLELTTSSTRADVAARINEFSGQTGVVASDNGKGLTLTAADGRNISIGLGSLQVAKAMKALARLASRAAPSVPARVVPRWLISIFPPQPVQRLPWKCSMVRWCRSRLTALTWVRFKIA